MTIDSADILIQKKPGKKEKLVTKVVVGILRPFNRHKMVHLDHIRQDRDNPLVFLGNHAEIYGPIASALCFPVPVRFWVISHMMANVMCGLNSIPVYRDSPMKLRMTLRKSVEALENGDNLMIFPEHPDGKYVKGSVSEFSPGFLMLAEAWWKKTGKKLRILPVFANRTERTFTFGEEICYEPANGFAAEQERILKDARNQMLRMAGEDTEE